LFRANFAIFRLYARAYIVAMPLSVAGRGLRSHAVSAAQRLRLYREQLGDRYRAANAERMRSSRAEKRKSELLDRDALASSLAEAKRLRATVTRIAQERDDLRAELDAVRATSMPSLAELVLKVRAALPRFFLAGYVAPCDFL
jgi:hypothetical protein